MQDDASAREAFNVLTDEEVRESINDAIENIGQNIKVIFRSKKCQDCGQIGDERLLNKYCHMQSTWIHTGISENCHPGFTEPYHRHVDNDYCLIILIIYRFKKKSKLTICYISTN